MPFLNFEDVSIYYEDSGEELPSVLLLAPGGMRSAVDLWEKVSWDPRTYLRGHYRIIAMDQRNAGKSSAPVSGDDGWSCYTRDQVRLINYLNIDKFHVLGMCIGGPFCLGLIEELGDRILSATLIQPIGLNKNRHLFYSLFNEWREGLTSQGHDLTEGDWKNFCENMFGSDKILFNVDEDFLSKCTVPLLILMGNDNYHPQLTSLKINNKAKNSTLIKEWKHGKNKLLAAQRMINFIGNNVR